MRRTLFALTAILAGLAMAAFHGPVEAGDRGKGFGSPFHHTDQFDRIDEKKRDRERAKKRKVQKKRAAERRAARQRAAKRKAAERRAAERRAVARKKEAARQRAAARKAAASRQAAAKRAAARRAATQQAAIQARAKATKSRSTAVTGGIAKAAATSETAKAPIVLPERAEAVVEKAREAGLAVSTEAVNKSASSPARIVEKVAKDVKKTSEGATCRRYLPSAGVTIEVPCGP